MIVPLQTMPIRPKPSMKSVEFDRLFFAEVIKPLSAIGFKPRGMYASTLDLIDGITHITLMRHGGRMSVPGSGMDIVLSAYVPNEYRHQRSAYKRYRFGHHSLPLHVQAVPIDCWQCHA